MGVAVVVTPGKLVDVEVVVEVRDGGDWSVGVPVMVGALVLVGIGVGEGMPTV